tara:strand:+ start:421 stop:1977 length:1557 start_codon:yes stop_codon:yes gene_type:complete
MQLPNVDEMSSEEKFWFASSIAGMVVADGQAVATELVFLRDAINFLENKDEIEKIMKIVKLGTLPNLKQIDIDPKQAFLMLKYLAQLMVVDSNLSSHEISFFLLTGKLLNFNDAILTKLWKSARSLLEKDLPQAIVETGKLNTKVSLTKVDENGVTFRLGKALMPHAKIYIKVLKGVHSEFPLSGDEKHWDNLVCKMEKQHQIKFDEGSYVVRAHFEQRLSESHGILQIIHPENYAVVSDGGFFETEKNSLMGSFLRCYICDNPKIKFYVLHSKSMITESNIFGVSSYIRPSGKLKFCDFNLVQVASCSECGFSSNDKEHFKRLKTSSDNFSVEEFKNGWEEKISPFLKKAKDSGESFFGENRNQEQGIISYDLAISTFDQMAGIFKDDQKKSSALRKQASMLMIQAELLMENKQRDLAEKNLKKVSEILEPIFEKLKSVDIIHVCLLLFQIKIYLNDLQSAAKYMKFLDNYDTEGKLEEGSEEFKALKVSSAKLKATFDDREILSKDKLNHFHLDDE